MMFIFIHSCDIGNICYLLSVICYLYYEVHWFCFWIGYYPLSVWLLNPSIFIFSPRCGCYGWLQSCILSYDLVKWCLQLLIALAKSCPTRIPEFVRPENNRVWLSIFCPNLKFGHSDVSELKIGSGSGLPFRVRVVRISS